LDNIYRISRMKRGVVGMGIGNNATV